MKFSQHRISTSRLIDLQNRQIMKQLVFYGKKTKPRALRRDMWRPFASVTFPQGSEEDGLRAYRVLREFRLLRDYAWREIPQFNPALRDSSEFRDAPKFSTGYSDIEDGKLQLKKMEKVKEMIRKKRRAWMLMDQRATSVADLAKVLQMREGWVREKEAKVKKKKDAEETKHASQWARVERLAALARGSRMETIQRHLAREQDRLEKFKRDNVLEKITETEKLVKNLMTARNRLQRAREAVDEVDGMNLSNSKKKRWNQVLTSLVETQKQKVGKKVESTSEESIPKTVEQAVQDAKESTLQQLSNEPAQDGLHEVENEAPTKETTKVMESWRTVRKGRRKGKKKRIFRKERFGREVELDTTELPAEAIKIKWLDLRNAEWAESWPDDVYHAHMGLLTEQTKYTMPHPDEAPRFEPKEWVERGEEQPDEDIILDGMAYEEDVGGLEEAVNNTEQKSSKSRFSFLRVSSIRNWFGGRADA